MEIQLQVHTESNEPLDPEDALVCAAACEMIIASRRQARANGKHTADSWRKQGQPEQLGKAARHSIQALRELLKTDHYNLTPRQHEDARRYCLKAQENLTFLLVALGVTEWNKSIDQGEKVLHNAVARMAQAAALKIGPPKEAPKCSS